MIGVEIMGGYDGILFWECDICENTILRFAEDITEKYLSGFITKNVYQEALNVSLLAHQSLMCRGLSRVDLRYDGEKLFVLEVNTQPGMTPTSLAPEQAAYLNISFNELVTWLVENATLDT